jgi:peptidoglycan-N-acetylglucosamine deacetylase
VRSAFGDFVNIAIAMSGSAEGPSEMTLRRTTYVTTSWDDGHPLDFKVAELLHKYRLRGTFYVPTTAENETMTATEVRQLSREFEIGAHTLHHAVLTKATDERARREIVDSKSWVENIAGAPCLMFCPPQGQYWSRHLKMVWQAGYIGLRSVEMGSLDVPRPEAGGLLMPTSLQAHPHGAGVFVANALKRAAFANLWRFVARGRSSEWPQLARSYFREALNRGGVFHLWGHSWELQATDQWRRLDDVLRFLGEFAGEAHFLTNGQLCQTLLTRSADVAAGSS